MSAVRDGKSIADLPDEHWGPIVQHDQSQYIDGLCERCGGWIATGERHLVRHWLSGPAEACQHLVCPDDTGENQSDDSQQYSEPWWVGRADRDQLTGAFLPESEVQDPLTGQWHTKSHRHRVG